MVGRVIEFVRHCSFMAFQVDDRYFFRTRLLGSGFYPHLDVVVSFDRLTLLFYQHSVYTSVMAEKSQVVDFPG